MALFAFAFLQKLEFDGGELQLMKTVFSRTGIGGIPMTVTSLSQLDELVGKHVTGETPEIVWQDSNGLFQFATRDEALVAIKDSYYQMFDAKADWENAEVVQVKHYHPYSSDLGFAWQVVERMSDEKRPLEMRREGLDWIASFGGGGTVAAQTAPLAICLAALRVHGIEAVVKLAEIR